MISGLNEFRILDLFCGAGGLSWGMHKNPYFKTMVALDFDEKAVATFKNNMPGSEVLVGDITDATVKEKVVSLSRKKCVNMIVGGPPCQGYSMKGKKLGLDDPRNFLFREYLDLVEKLQPDVFVIENVKGLLLSANGWLRNWDIQLSLIFLMRQILECHSQEKELFLFVLSMEQFRCQSLL